MSFLDEYQVDKIKKGLISDLSNLGKIYKAKKSKFMTKNVNHSLVEDMIKEGWEEYGKPLKTKSHLRKRKDHDIEFEDDIWCQLYELGYRRLNYDENFILPYGKGDDEKKQIDVIAIGEDTILLIECKSSEKPARAPSFKTEFEGLDRRLDGFRKVLCR